MSNPVIEFQNLSFSYDTTPLFQGVNFSINEGEYIGVIGPNGGGKTTALKLMMGFLKPTKGDVLLFSSDPKKNRTRIGYVPQITSYDKKFPVSVLDVVLMGTLSYAPWWGFTSQSEKKNALKALDHVGLCDYYDYPFGTLSGGQAQRVLIARAIANDPDILLFDEPTTNVDPEAEEAIFSLLNTLKTKKTLLIVTHDFDAIIKNVERVLLFKKEVSSLKPSEVCEHFTMGLYHNLTPPYKND